MSGPVSDHQDMPLDLDTYKHQLLLLKSLHCARPALYRGASQFIQCLSANLSGGGIQMTVYLAGIKGGIDSGEIQIKSSATQQKESTE